MGASTASPRALIEFFKRVARECPKRIAVDAPPTLGRPLRELVTYEELDERSDALASRVQEWVERESVVAILLPRDTSRLYVAQIAVLKAGGAFVCLDTTFPDERVAAILKDANAVAVITDSEGVSRVGERSVPVIECEHAEGTFEADFHSEYPGDVNPEDLAYMIYTSGTTGSPKGVMVENHSIANLVASDLEAFGLGPEDRVVQGSSPAYDSSIEEIWLAFASGATLVVMDEDTARSGPDLIHWLRRERVTVFCPPPTLLRATGCMAPAEALPELRLLYVGGEALDSELADRWAVGRTLVNGYGPTECAVTCLRVDVEVGQPISIGLPIPRTRAWALNAELEEVSRGERGELCIGGVCLARGYRNRPALTSEKFISHPKFGRIYRTGDLVHQDAIGNFYYLGRLDSQVKLRGYRIELGEVEVCLASLSGVRAAACTLQEHRGRPVLVAFVTLEDSCRLFDADAIRAELSARIPDYMIPSRIGILEVLPTSIGGKLDRQALPRLELSGDAKALTDEGPTNPLEEWIQEAVARAFGLERDISIQDDFFQDLGGDSLSAAQLVSLLRSDSRTDWVTVRDIYEARSVARLSEKTPSTEGDVGSGEESDENVEALRFPWRMRRAGLFQALWIGKDFLLGGIVTYLILFHLFPGALRAIGVIGFMILAPLFVLAATPLYTLCAVGYAVSVKRALIGRYEARRAPVWSRFYLRNWIVQSAVQRIPWGILAGTEFYNMALRALGARIGRRVHIHRGVDLLRGGWDLLDVGDDVSIGQDVSLGLVEYEKGDIVMSPVCLKKGSVLETHAHVGGGATIGEGALLTARSSVPRGVSIPAKERWDGVPASRSGVVPKTPDAPIGAVNVDPVVAGARLLLARAVLVGALILPFELCGIGMVWLAGAFGGSTDVLNWLLAPTLTPITLVVFGALSFLPTPFAVFLEALACRLMGPTPVGVIGRWTPAYIKVWLKAELVDSGSGWLYGTLFWPIWLRVAGMRVGRNCEISSLIDTPPDLVEIGAQTFCADGIYLGGAQVRNGVVVMERSRIGGNCFIGNGAVIPAGVSIPDGVLLGVCTVADAGRLRPGTSWFGHPAFEMPRPEASAFDRKQTHEPGVAQWMTRVFWECARFGLPVAFGWVLAIWYTCALQAGTALSIAGLILVGLPALNLLAMLAPATLALGIKWALLGRVRPGTHPLWSSWASRWDFYCLTWNVYAASAVSLLDGTPALAWLLRATGMRVGRNAILSGGFADDLPDPDMLHIEDGATLDCLFQAHTFEDRALKMDYVRVRRGATVERNAVILYGADIGEFASVAPNSVVMKGESLVEKRRYVGVPTREDSR